MCTNKCEVATGGIRKAWYAVECMLSGDLRQYVQWCVREKCEGQCDYGARCDFGASVRKDVGDGDCVCKEHALLWRLSVDGPEYLGSTGVRLLDSQRRCLRSISWSLISTLQGAVLASLGVLRQGTGDLAASRLEEVTALAAVRWRRHQNSKGGRSGAVAGGMSTTPTACLYSRKGAVVS